MKKYLKIMWAMLLIANAISAQVTTPSSPVNAPKINNANIQKANNGVKSIRYRITVNGFTVNKPTADHILEVDGKGDEIFLYGFAQKFNAAGEKMETKRTRQSLVMGDVNNDNWRQGERIKAGSKAGEQGGLQSGDRVPTNEPWKQYNKPNTKTLPFIISEGVMQQGETIVAIPSIWEYDGTTEFEQGLNAFLSDATKVTVVAGSAAGAFVMGGPGAAVATVSIAMIADFQQNRYRPLVDEANNNPIFSKINNPSSDFNVYVRKTLFGDAKDRPIGMDDAGNGGFTFSPLAMKLDYENMLRYAWMDFGFGRGVLPLKFLEPAGLQGNYTLYVQIEATKDTGPLVMDAKFNPDEAITAEALYAISSAYDNGILFSTLEGKAGVGNRGQHSGSWILKKVPNTSNQFYIENTYIPADGKVRVLDVFNHSMDNGGEVITYPFISATNQRWKITPYGDGTFSIIALESGKALSFDFKTNRLIQYENRYNPDQRWKIE